MPYRSLAQERYFNANRKKLEAQGVNVGEWNSASKGMTLPYHSSDAHRRPAVRHNPIPIVYRPKVMAAALRKGLNVRG